MALNLIELLTDESGQPRLETSDVRFRSSNNDLTGEMAKVSEASDCRLMVFVELPVGFKSSLRIPDRDQMTVVLSGALRITATEDAARRVESGGVFRLPKAECSSHTLEVFGQEAVTMMVLQA